MATIMVTANQGFDEAYYLSAKAAQLTASTGQPWTVASTLAAIEAAGMTAEEHYSTYGFNEGLSPNAYYDDNYYALSKATEAGISTDQLRLDWYNASGSDNLYTHYMQYGAYETGVNPSSGFNDQAYYAAKAAQMGGGATWETARDAIEAAGMNAVSHYLTYGQSEGVEYDPTPIGPSDTTVTLTVDPDIKTANVFEAPLVQSFGATNMTLNSTDVLTGSGTNPTLNAVLTDITGTVTPTMTGVETLNLQALTVAGSIAAAATIDLRNTTGELTISNHDSTDGLTVRNITLVNPVDKAAGTTLNVTNDGGNGSTFTFTDASLAGTTDSVALNLTNSTGVVGLASASGSNTIETVNVTSSGAIGTNFNGNIASTYGGASTIVVGHNASGDANLNLGAGNAQLTGITATTIDASAFTSDLKATLGAANTKITGGSGNDHFNFLGNLTSSDTIDGGKGANSLSANISGLTLSKLSITNVQTIGLGVEAVVAGATHDVLGGLTAAGSVDLAGISGITTLDIGTDDGGAGVTATVLNAPTTLTSITEHGTGNNVAGGQLGDNLLFKTSFTGTSDTITWTIDNIDFNGKHVANTNNFTTGTSNFSNGVTTSGVETLNINVADHANTFLSTVTDATLQHLTLTSAGNINSTVTGTTIVAGSSAVAGANNQLASVDATGVQGTFGTAANVIGIDGLANNATVTLGNGGSNILIHGTGSAAANAYAITGGTGADIITGDNAGADAMLGAMTIHGGGGNDTITGGSGVDALFGDDGIDTIAAGLGGSSITGGKGADRLTGTTAKVDTFNFAAGDSALGSAANAATNCDKIATAGAVWGAGDIIHDSTGSISLMAAGSTGLTINAAGLVTAGATDLGDFVSKASLATTAQAAAVYVSGGNSYVFISDGTSGLTDGDLLVEVTGVAAAAGLTLTTGNITNVA